MSERRQNVIMWVMGLACLALCIIAIAADDSGEATESPSARVYTEVEMQTINEYNESGPQPEDLDHPSSVQGGGTP